MEGKTLPSINTDVGPIVNQWSEQILKRTLLWNWNNKYFGFLGNIDVYNGNFEISDSKEPI